MISLEEVRDITFNTSRRRLNLIKKIDRRIKRNAVVGKVSLAVKKPRRMTDMVFQSIGKDYAKKGFWVGNYPLNSITISWKDERTNK